MSQGMYEAIIRETGEHKAKSLTDPNGVLYMDHLWGMVMHESDLAVVLRSDAETFSDVAVRTWFRHGNYHWEEEASQERGELVFEVPDEVSRRLQSRHAQGVLQRFFGQNVEVEVEAPFLGETSDDTRLEFYAHSEANAGEGFSYDEIINDWSALKQAIKTSAGDMGGYIGGQSITLLGTAGTGRGLARVQGKQLELYISPKMVDATNQLWSQAFGREVVLEGKS
jgi:hypothetical protein